MPVTDCPDCGLRAEHDKHPHACRIDELRDAFAQAALIGQLARLKVVPSSIAWDIARDAYDIADAMLAERRRRRDAAREGA